MAKLEDIVAGSRVRGIVARCGVSVVATQWHGSAVLQVTYRTDDGSLGETILMRDSETSLEIEGGRPWSFDASADDVRLASEAYRISLAHLFDPYLAVRTSAIDPLPHQISAVYQEMLPRLPLRYVLADDPGAGKTIMTGLLIKEMMARGDVCRCLIVCPGNLAEQWQDELFSKFGLRFEILTNDAFESAVTGNVFHEKDRCIARLDKLARNENVQAKLADSAWDLVVCDEAHKMSATVFGGEAKYTKRYQLGRLLGEITENLLLLTATPHNGKPDDFQLFMSLVDRDRFEGARRNSNHSVDVSDVMRRLVKEELLKFDGRPLFPERIAYTVNYSLSSAEAGLYHAVTDYVTQEFNRADRLDGKRRSSVGFALTVLQRRLASSPEAIYQSLKRRRERLEARLQEAKLGMRAAVGSLGSSLAISAWDANDFDEDDFTGEEYENLENGVADTASAAETAAELEVEIATLRRLERMANDVRQSGVDRKWDELSRLLQDESNMFEDGGRREKLIIFTEHKDTLVYLVSKIRQLLGDEDAVLTISGGMLRDERRKVEERFKQDKAARILVATDAAGEGINLQRAHLMVNYDLPWNPNRLEQRFGRIHRIGQTEVCHLWNLVATETREGEVFQRLLAKLNEERMALGGKVFDVLGRLTFDDKPLRDLLIEAIRYGDRPDVRARLSQVVDASLDAEGIRKLLQDYALVENMMDARSVRAVREDMERMEARKLEPHFIEAFFVEAFERLGGSLVVREEGRYEVLQVPFDVRSYDMRLGSASPVLKAYERICFAKDCCNVQGCVPAELVCPGHPLLDAVCAVVRERFAGALKKGAVLVDESSQAYEPRLLFFVEQAVRDGVVLPDGSLRTISKSVRFVELNEAGEALDGGYAPYLDYRAPQGEERERIEEVLAEQSWLTRDAEALARSYAVGTLMPKELEAVQTRRFEQIRKVERAVEERLTSEIRYWDSRAWELREKEQAGKRNAKLNSQNAERRAEELADRLQQRREQIARERDIRAVPPLIVGAALVVPAALLRSDASADPDPNVLSQADRRRTEHAAMEAVMSIERELGFRPKDVSAARCGYDIESQVPDGAEVTVNASPALTNAGCALRLIEVKGRVAGAAEVMVTKNEILCALNSPESFILALVEVDGECTKTTYLKKPFSSAPDFGATCVVYKIDDLVAKAEVVLVKETLA